MKKLVLAVSCLTLVLFLPGFAGCNSSSPLISGVSFSTEPNLETAKVALNFAKDVESDLGGSFEIVNNGTDYGTLELDPTTPATPFAVGFRLNLEILNDQDYVKLDPVVDLPTGQPLPVPNLNRAFGRLALKNPLNPNFDVYAYLDVVGKEWIGVAVTMRVLGNKYFPAGLSVSQGFIKSKADGSNLAWASVFGPKVDSNGNLATPGGIALFANVSALLKGNAGRISSRLVKPDKFYLFQGPLAPHYSTHPKDAALLPEGFKAALRAM